VKVVQELIRHASTRFTLEIYSQAHLIAKRAAQQPLVILPEGIADSLPSIVVATAAPWCLSGAIWSGAIFPNAA
jgi:hypothetical protein